MYPLSFREFILNTGIDEKVFDYVSKSLSDRTTIDSTVHESMRSLYLQYLEDVGLVVRAYNTRELVYPLESSKILTEFKVFYIDTGLLVSQLGDDVPEKILSGDLSSYKGAIAENMVAASFEKNDIGLFYFHAPSGSPELDFLYEKDGNVGIIECKASNNRATSMKFVLANSKKYGTHPATKIADTNVGKGEGFNTFPLYSLGFINKKSKQRNIASVDVKNIEIPE